MRDSESRFFTRVVSESRLVRTGDAGFVGDEFWIPFADTGIDEPRLPGLSRLPARQLCAESERLLVFVMDDGPLGGMRDDVVKLPVLLLRLLLDGGPDGLLFVFSGGFGAT